MNINVHKTPHYVGRFAPSPTGPLHFGSIIAALASYLDAKYHQGLWLVRIDDLDTPRLQPGAADDILFSLEKLGLHWDRGIVYQSKRQLAYRSAEKELDDKELLYPCYCSRKTVAGKPYSGTCLNRQAIKNTQHSIRVKTQAGSISFTDLIQGKFEQNLKNDVGDFIVKRADGLYAYHLAVAVDDAEQGVTHIVRGSDLLESTPRQIYLQQQLSLITPLYSHLPVATTHLSEKISKQCKALDVLSQEKPENILIHSLAHLGQQPDASLKKANNKEILQWAVSNWNLSQVPKTSEIIAPSQYYSSG
jgi:glutamyl-Q tRNA(Asp) synthetase